MKKKVLIVVDYYLPGFKGGGPIASVSRIVRALGGSYEFFVLTRDRDLHDQIPYEGMVSNAWIPCEGGQIYYCSPKRLTLEGMADAMRQINPDVVYLNSFFSKTTRLALAIRTMGLVRCSRWVVAPRGEFYPGAKSIKRLKKALYIHAVKASCFCHDVVWHASTEDEAKFVRETLGGSIGSVIVIVDPIGPLPIERDRFVTSSKRCGEATFSWVSRIVRSKNLKQALHALATTEGEVKLSIYGPIEDEDYWAECRAEIDRLPPNVIAEYKGLLPRHLVAQAMSECQFFLFPTLGENYGHVIAEALSVGRPILLSDQTPWAEIQSVGGGWELPLDPVEGWQATVFECVKMPEGEYRRRSQAALDYCLKVQSLNNVDRNREIFDSKAA